MIKRLFSAAVGHNWEHLLVSTRKKVGIIQLNRPAALNALCSPLFTELNAAMDAFDNDKNVGAIVLTGSEKAFAAGADIKEMVDREFVQNYTGNFLAHWTDILNIKKPIVAAVNGFAVCSF